MILPMASWREQPGLDRLTAALGAEAGLCRFVGGAVAPALAGVIAASLGNGAPYWIGCAGLLVSIAVLALGRRHLARIDSHREESLPEEALVLTAADS